MLNNHDHLFRINKEISPHIFHSTTSSMAPPLNSHGQISPSFSLPISTIKPSFNAPIASSPSSPSSSPSTPSSTAIPSPSPVVAHLSIGQVLLPFLPILALAFLCLFLFRLLLRQCRQCLFMRLQMASGLQHRQQQQSGGTSNGGNLPYAADSFHANNEITPWTGTEPCGTPPLFLLQHAELFFPSAEHSGAGFVDPTTAAAFWLDHHQLVHMLGPMPPKYEEAIKKQHPVIRTIPSQVQRLSIPSLQSRMQQQQQQQPSVLASPPPCYEQASQMPSMVPSPQPEQTPNLPRIRSSQQEQPPSYNHSVGHAISAEELLTVNGNSSSGNSSRTFSLPPPDDRPCSSCSLASFTSLQDPAAAVDQRKKALGKFVAKHSLASRQHQRQLKRPDGTL